MAKTTLDDLLTHDINGEEETRPDVAEKRIKYPRSGGPRSPMQSTIILNPKTSYLMHEIANLNLWQRNPDFLFGDSYTVYHCHPKYKSTPYFTSYPEVRRNKGHILATLNMKQQAKEGWHASDEENKRQVEQYHTPSRVEVVKLYRDKTVSIPIKRKAAIFLLEGDAWVLTSKESGDMGMLMMQDIRHGEQGLWLKAVRERKIFPRRLMGKDYGVLVGNVHKTVLVPEVDSLVLVVDYD